MSELTISPDEIKGALADFVSSYEASTSAVVEVDAA